ncbi:MAG: hypothetical protein IPJ88_05435 [Myxococcales bacterium]|nr:MAG: hypothetical protein IPJ88_05435 [Myxococcales bacterium]
MWKVPSDFGSYAAIFHIVATDASGKSITTAFSVGVKRLLDAVYNGNLRVAEILSPINTSGCMYGGVNNRQVTYGKSYSDTRAVSTSVSWSDSFSSSHSISTADQIGTVQTNSTGDQVGVTTGNNVVVALGGTAESNTSFFGVQSFKFAAAPSCGNTAINQQANSTSNSDSLSTSEVTTDTTTDVETRTRQDAGAVSDTVSSTKQTNESYGGEIISYTYGVFFLQPVRMVRNVSLVMYNSCGEVEDVVGDFLVDEWKWNLSLALGEQCFDDTTFELMEAEGLDEPACLIPPCNYQY